MTDGEALHEALDGLLVIRRTLSEFISGPTNAHTVGSLLGVMQALHTVATRTVDRIVMP